MSKIYRIVPLGQTGSGKSQLCNFICRDKSNKKFIVSDGLNSQTKKPQVESFTRQVNRKDIKIELIDTPGCSDSEGEELKNFKLLIDELRQLKSIDLFLLVLNFTTRIDQSVRNYLQLISSTFTPMEFYNHLAIIFTNYKEKPSKRDIEKKEIKLGQLIDILKETIGISSSYTTFIPEVYEIDTEKDDNNNFIEKFQSTIDIILLKMQTIIELNGEINTGNIEFNRVKDRMIEEEERFKKLQKHLENQLKEKEQNIKKYKKKFTEIKKQFNEQINEHEEQIYQYKKEIKRYEEKEEKVKKKYEDAKQRDSLEKEKQNKFDIKIRELDELIEKKQKEEFKGIISAIAGIGISFIGAGALIGIPLFTYGVATLSQAGNEKEQYKSEKSQLEIASTINA